MIQIMKKAVFNWSGGKDSALAMYHILKEQQYQIDSLITNINKYHQRISMHGVREELLDQQVKALGLEINKLYLPKNPDMNTYNTLMAELMNKLVKEGYKYSIFGDIFLEDLKKYREKSLNEVGLQGIFPLWKQNTTQLIHEFLDLGFKTITVCVDSRLLDSSFVGRVINKEFIDDLPKGVDPCGENGEFHTFVFEGPIFKKSIHFQIGKKVYREYTINTKNTSSECNQTYKEEKVGYWFCDLIPEF